VREKNEPPSDKRTAVYSLRVKTRDHRWMVIFVGNPAERTDVIY